MNKAKIKKTTPNIIAENRKARHDYSFEEKFEAGLVLEGWEVKSIREGKIQLRDSYVLIKKAEAWLIGAHISPLNTASTHIKADPTRTRKLLLHDKELRKLIGAVEREGYTLIVISLYWKKNKIKANLGLAKGKKSFDKRADMKEKDWAIEKNRLMKKSHL